MFRHLLIRPRYNCSIEDFEKDIYFTNNENDTETFFCDFVQADQCEPNYCVKRHMQNIMLDFTNIYLYAIKLKCDDPAIRSCFIVTGSGIYMSSAKGWLQPGIESGQEALELKTKNQLLSEALLISRPNKINGIWHINVTKSISTVSKGTELFLATIGMEIRLERIKLEILKQAKQHNTDIMLVDENMLIIVGFTKDGDETDGHRLKSFYPEISRELVELNIYFVFGYHECLNECIVPVDPPDSCLEHPGSFYCEKVPKTKLELCCMEFSTYSRNSSNFPLHMPYSVSVKGDNCTSTYGIRDIPYTNMLALIDLTPGCTRPPRHHLSNKDRPYNEGICQRLKRDYYRPPKQCFSAQGGDQCSEKREDGHRGNDEPTETSKQPIGTRYLGHMAGYQPISIDLSFSTIVTSHSDKQGPLSNRPLPKAIKIIERFYQFLSYLKQVKQV
eukprot:sb/3464699/